MSLNQKAIKQHLNIKKLTFLYDCFKNNQFKRSDVPNIKFNQYFDDYAYYLCISGLLRHDKHGFYHVSHHPIVMGLLKGKISKKRFLNALFTADKKYGSDYRYFLYCTDEITAITDLDFKEWNKYTLMR